MASSMVGQEESNNLQSSYSFVVCRNRPTVEGLGHLLVASSGEKGDAHLEQEYGIQNFHNFPGVKFLKKFQQQKEEGDKEKMIFVQGVPKGGFHCFKPFCEVDPIMKIIFTLSLYTKFLNFFKSKAFTERMIKFKNTAFSNGVGASSSSNTTMGGGRCQTFWGREFQFFVGKLWGECGVED